MRREHEVVTNRVGIIDLTPFAKFMVGGSDARSYLDYLVAGTVPKEGRDGKMGFGSLHFHFLVTVTWHKVTLLLNVSLRVCPKSQRHMLHWKFYLLMSRFVQDLKSLITS